MMSVTCPKCGAPNSDTAMGCTTCGHSFVITLPGNPAWSQSVGSFAPPPPLQEPGEAKTALIASIVAFFCCGPLAAPYAIIKALAAKRIIAANPGTPGETKANIALGISALSLLSWIFWGIHLLSARL
ncbi:hypothetical protein [Pendulispora albinea]|uniref:Zinc ribbon domain-containing protein n=1 Tax=Pendulispora albinea TaxID=2741071 RepID=A0ABZ2LW86_9BACT